MAAPCVTVGKVRARLVFDAETVEDQPQKENKTNASLVTPFEQAEQAFLKFPSNSSILSSPDQGGPLSGFDSDATEEQKVPQSRKFVKLLDKFDAAGSQLPLFDMQLSLRLNAIAVMEKHKQSRQEKNLSVLELDRALDELRNYAAPTLLEISLRPSTLTAEDEARMAEEDKISSDKLRRLNREWAEGGREFSRNLAKLEQQVDEMVESEDREVSYLIAAEEGRKQDTTW